MVKVRVNGFGCIGHLVTNSGKADIVAIIDPFIDLNSMIYMFYYDSIHGKFKGTVKAENEKLIISGKFISILKEQDPPTSNGVMLVLNMLWSPLGSSLPWIKLGLT